MTKRKKVQLVPFGSGAIRYEVIQNGYVSLELLGRNLSLFCDIENPKDGEDHFPWNKELKKEREGQLADAKMAIKMLEKFIEEVTNAYA